MRKKKNKGTKVMIGLLSCVLLAGILFFLLVSNFYLSVDENDRDVVLEYQSEYKDDIPTAYLKGKIFWKDGYPLDVETTGKVDTEKVGEYKITYRTQFLIWEKEWTKTILVKDTKKPEITLKSTEGYYVLPGHKYEEEGYSAYDAHDGDLTDKVTCTEENGIVIYRVSDKAGNQTTAERKIHYDDPVPPEIKLAGNKIVTITVGGRYKEPGYTAVDNCDGDITQNVKVDGNVDTTSAGRYKLIYTVEDAYKNKTSVERTVIVKEIKRQEPEPIPKPKPDRKPETVVKGDKVVYLTFDDGPGPYTQQLLAVLDKYHVKATFFVVNGKYNHLIAKEAKAGHSVGIHSATHDYAKIYANKKAYFNDLLKMQNIIYNQTGKKPTIMRFPGGSSNLVSRKYCPGIMTDLTKSVADAGFQYFDWNVSSGDAGETRKTSVVASNVINGIKNKKVSVVLQHDIHKFSVDAVEEIIVWGLNHGYTFKALDMSSPGMHHGVQN